MIDENNIPHQLSNYYTEQVEEEFVFLHQSGLKVLHSNQTGTLIWQLCDGKRSVANIIALLSETYPEAAETISEDVKETLSTLAQHGVIGWQ